MFRFKSRIEHLRRKESTVRTKFAIMRHFSSFWCVLFAYTIKSVVIKDEQTLLLYYMFKKEGDYDEG